MFTTKTPETTITTPIICNHDIDSANKNTPANRVITEDKTIDSETIETSVSFKILSIKNQPVARIRPLIAKIHINLYLMISYITLKL